MPTRQTNESLFKELDLKYDLAFQMSLQSNVVAIIVLRR